MGLEDPLTRTRRIMDEARDLLIGGNFQGKPGCEKAYAKAVKAHGALRNDSGLVKTDLAWLDA